MPDLLKTASDWLTGTLKASVSQPIALRRGSVAIDLSATLGSTEWTSDQLEGISETWESLDFLVEAADVVLDGERIEPRSGDKIEHCTGGTTVLYEVLSQPGVPPFSYSDPNRVGLRIHTKRVSK